jgi:hypothetical protein
MKTDDKSIGCFHLTGIAGQDGRQMSIEALTVVLHHSKAKPTAKLVLLGIANHYHPDDDRGAWPSQDTLAKYSNVSARQVRNLIDELVKIGELQVDVYGGQSQTRNKPNRYWITLECPEDCDGSMHHRPRPETQYPTTGNVVFDDRKPSAPRPEAEFLRTLSEPKEEPINNLKAKKIKDADEYEPSEAIKADFETRYPGLRLDVELEKFRDHHMAAGSNFKDWDRAMRKWLRQASEWSKEARAERARLDSDAEWEKYKRENGLD